MTEQERAEQLEEIRQMRAEIFADQVERFLWDVAMADRLERLGVSV